MTPLFNQIIPTHQRIALQRLNRVMQYGSPTYSHEPGVITATNHVNYSLQSQFPAARKYDYMDYMEIVNNDAVAIQITLNGNSGYIKTVPAHTTRTFHDMPFTMWRVTNLDAAVDTTAAAIRITMQREAMDADKKARQEYGEA